MRSIAFLILFCLPLFAASLSSSEYVEQCRAAGVIVPRGLSCADGEELPVSANGTRVTRENFETLAGNGQCDHPALVQRNNPRVGCMPEARALWWESKTDPTICAMVCRRTDNATPAGYFQDISFLCHNPQNGATCFFNSKVEGRVHSGAKMPSPAEKNDFWMEPAELNVATCTHCHDARPFLTTPNLGAFGKKLRRRYDELSSGKYEIVGNGLPFSSHVWKDRYVLAEPNRCTGCHEIGAGRYGGCGHLRDSAVGHNPFLSSPPRAWMPPRLENADTYASDVAKIRMCCADFDLQGRLSPRPRCQWKLKD